MDKTKCAQKCVYIYNATAHGNKILQKTHMHMLEKLLDTKMILEVIAIFPTNAFAGRLSVQFLRWVLHIFFIPHFFTG